MNKSLKESVLASIKDNNIKPTAKWQYQLKALLFWAVFIVAVLVGAHAVGFIFHLLMLPDTPVFNGPRPRMGMHAMIIPLIWIAIYGIFIAIADWFFRHTPKGYKWSLSQLLGLNLILSLIIGTLFYVIGASHSFDTEVMRNVAPRFGGDQFRERVWDKPEEGFLAGEIITIASGSVTIKDRRQQRWTIKNIENTTIATGSHVGLRGAVKSDYMFEAEEVRLLPKRPPSRR
jgi:hypothetical protein